MDRLLPLARATGEQANVAEIVQAADLANRNATRNVLHRMDRSGEVRKVQHGAYALPAPRNSVNYEMMAGKAQPTQGDAGAEQN